MRHAGRDRDCAFFVIVRYPIGDNRLDVAFKGLQVQERAQVTGSIASQVQREALGTRVGCEFESHSLVVFDWKVCHFNNFPSTDPLIRHAAADHNTVPAGCGPIDL